MLAMIINMKIKCKDCGILKLRTFHSKTKTKTRYVDETHRFWDGRTCPACRFDNARPDLQVKEPKITGFEGLSADMEDCIYN